MNVRKFYKNYEEFKAEYWKHHSHDGSTTECAIWWELWKVNNRGRKR